jgi:hypothetical protein
MVRVLLIIGLLLPLPSVAQGVPKDDVLQAASDIQKAVEGTDQLRLRVNRYCHVTITHEPEEALLKVISAHVLNQKYNILASDMLYVIRASVLTEEQLMLWSNDCSQNGDTEAHHLATQLIDSHLSLHRVNGRFWDLLAKQIDAEERSRLREQ